MSETPTKTAEPKAEAPLKEVAAPSPKKDSTIELPMFDLNEVLNFVSQIREKALEAVPMPKVAEGMGYTHPSSTPFYRRMVAARHFGLISKTGAELSVRARAIFKPDSDDARPKALYDAVTGISIYADEVQRANGKRLNVQYIANSFAAKLNLTDGCALTCARVFEASLKTAGLVGPDGTIGQHGSAKNGTAPSPDAPPIANSNSKPATDPTHVLHLSGQRSVTVTAPLDMTAKEILRLKKWLEVTLLIDDDDEETDSPPLA